MGNENNLCKIVYFDEESVTDYIQIMLGGKLEKTTELLNEGSTQGDASARAKANIGVGGVFRALVGMETSVAIDSGIQTSFNTQEMAKNIIKNTILTDFIDILEGSENSKSIQTFREYSISIHKESLTYIALISPYLAMLKGGPGIAAGEYNISVDKLENTMKSAKGYYEFIGKKDDETVIFRFNIKSFKNNYKVTDLLRMNITLYGIKVGKSSLNKLNFNGELELEVSTSLRDNPSYDGIVDEENDIEDFNQELDVYDVLLAGVEVDDK